MRVISFNDEVQMYNALEEYLNLGYKPVGNIDLNPILEHGEDKIILKYSNQKIEAREILYPDFNDTFLNIIGSIRENYGFLFPYRCNLKPFNKKYNHIIILLLDGMGINILNNNFKDDSFLKSLEMTKIHSIYPSTTAAATTSIKSGLTPLQSGWTGWENYVSEINKNVILFTGKDYYTEEPTGISGYSILPYKMFYEDMNGLGFCVEPDFRKEKYDITSLLRRSRNIIKKHSKSIQYVYYTEPDGLMHEFGAYSDQAKLECAHIDRCVRSYAKSLPDDALLIITADHGHTDVKKINLDKCKPLFNLLNRRPSNDARCITFSVKKDKDKEFEALFNSLYSSIYKLYKTEDAIKLGFFGDSNGYINPRINPFLADYVAVGINDYYFSYKEANFDFRSHHAGITKNEIEIPVLFYNGEKHEK